MSNLITINGVRGFIDENGTAQLNLEDVARGLGFTQTQRSGNDTVRWDRVREYLKSFGVHAKLYSTPTSGGDEFIPENIFYRLAMKAKNETAEKFQAIVADEILPAIRKTGTYSILPKSYADALRQLAEEVEQKELLQLENAQSKQIINELQPKATYYDMILQCKDLLAITTIAKDYGMSGKSLNSLLHELGVQYKMRKTWLLYQKHADKGYTQSKTHVINAERSEMNTYWTQKGRLFIYSLLKNEKGILPLIECNESEAV
ncbi:MAG: phage antirepressor protein [Firmicutes bacterium]|nr:phage antirepressor protein [Bacillota bacterium]